jgi:hypothetical protein
MVRYCIIWMYTPSAVSIFVSICALYKSTHFIFFGHRKPYFAATVFMRTLHIEAHHVSLQDHPDPADNHHNSATGNLLT